jgi:hypothetical protein
MPTNPTDDALDLAAAAWSRFSLPLLQKSVNPLFEDLPLELQISPTVTQPLAKLYLVSHRDMLTEI